MSLVSKITVNEICRIPIMLINFNVKSLLKTIKSLKNSIESSSSSCYTAYRAYRLIPQHGGSLQDCVYVLLHENNQIIFFSSFREKIGKIGHHCHWITTKKYTSALGAFNSIRTIRVIFMVWLTEKQNTFMQFRTERVQVRTTKITAFFFFRFSLLNRQY